MPEVKTSDFMQFANEHGALALFGLLMFIFIVWLVRELLKHSKNTTKVVVENTAAMKEHSEAVRQNTAAQQQLVNVTNSIIGIVASIHQNNNNNNNGGQ